jgi:hypothetical protein
MGRPTIDLNANTQLNNVRFNVSLNHAANEKRLA